MRTGYCSVVCLSPEKHMSENRRLLKTSRTSSRRRGPTTRRARQRKSKGCERSGRPSNKSESHRSSGRPREEECATSPEPIQSDFNGTDNEDEELADSSSDMDQDIFKGKFAIKDKDHPSHGTHADRFSRLPSKLKKEIQNFEPEVLLSIPGGLNESLA